MSDRPRTFRGGRRGAFVVGVVLVPVLALSACGPGWWTPVPGDPGGSEASAPSQALVTPEPTVDLGPDATLDVSVTDLPGAWNSAATAAGLPDTLPDPLFADDTTDGISSVTVPVGDGTLFVQWQADTGKVLILEVDVPIDGDPTASSALPTPMLAAFAHAGLGLSQAEASRFIDSTVNDAVTNAIDPSYIDLIVQSGSADFEVSIIGGTGSFIITPTADDGSDVASPSPTSSAS